MKKFMLIFFTICFSISFSKALTIRSGNHGDFYRVVIEADKELNFDRISFENPSMLILKINEQATPVLERNPKLKKPDFIQDFEIIKSYEDLKIILEFKKNVNYEIFTLADPFRIIIDIGDKKKTKKIKFAKKEKQKLNVVKKENHTKKETKKEDPIQELLVGKDKPQNDNLNKEIVFNVENKFSDPIAAIIQGKEISLIKELGQIQKSEKKIIVIDPGHGGHDPGAVRNGLKEKDVNLKFAKKLKEILEKDPRFEVYLTRNRDKFVPLYSRTVFAVKKKADLFISFHCNSSPSGLGTGTYIYTLNLRGARSKLARLVELRENKAVIDYVRVSANKSVNRIVADLAMNNTITEGNHFARISKKYLKNIVDFQGIDSANFAVLKTPGIPSVLIEIAYLTHPIDSQLLKSDIFLEKFNLELYQAILEYFFGNNSQKYAGK